MKIAFVDFEASSLRIAADDLSCTQGSFPIEVGVSVLDVDSGEIHTWSSLIRPDPKWDMATWSADSAAVHGIARTALDGAPESRTVAESVLNIVQDCDHVMAGHWFFDGRWADMLFKSAGIKADFRLKSFEDMQMQGVITMGQYCNIPDRSPDPAHRAGADAEEMARAFHTMWTMEPASPESYGM